LIYRICDVVSVRREEERAVMDLPRLRCRDDCTVFQYKMSARLKQRPSKR